MSGGGPLHGISVVELGGIGPAPFCGMMLADLGADVVALGRAQKRPHPVLDRGKRLQTVNLKDAGSRTSVARVIAGADVVIEGFRPGVAERLGLGPEAAARMNARLVYGRITGFGRNGPMANRAGHDINYIALSGALGSMRRNQEQPFVPLNLVADFGGGGMLLAVGVLAAVLRVRATGRGEVVDVAMVDGSALLMGMVYGFQASGRWGNAPGGNLFDGGAPFYDTYRCADDRYVAVGAIEPQFFLALITRLGLREQVDLGRQNDQSYWPELRTVIAEAFSRQGRDHWERLFANVDACVTPVLDMQEAPSHPQNVARGVFESIPGGHAPRQALRFSPVAPLEANGMVTL